MRRNSARSRTIQVSEQARLNKVPDREYSKLSAAAGRAILEVEQTAQTAEESIYAKEVNKTARDLYVEGTAMPGEAERDARNDSVAQAGGRALEGTEAACGRAQQGTEAADEETVSETNRKLRARLSQSAHFRTPSV